MNKSFEYLNTLTASIGMFLSYIGFVFLIILANKHATNWHLIWCGIYGITLMILHTSSTAYHGVTNSKIKNKLRYLDHSSIYLLIAGTYTPLALINLYGAWGWSLFGIIWCLFSIGVFFKLMDIRPFKNYDIYLYLTMGWLSIISIKQLYNNIDLIGIILIVCGGLFFTTGIFFYMWDNKKYFHAIWHLFYISGCICHYFAIVFYTIPYKM